MEAVIVDTRAGQSIGSSSARVQNTVTKSRKKLSEDPRQSNWDLLYASLYRKTRYSVTKCGRHEHLPCCDIALRRDQEAAAGCCGQLTSAWPLALAPTVNARSAQSRHASKLSGGRRTSVLSAKSDTLDFKAVITHVGENASSISAVVNNPMVVLNLRDNPGTESQFGREPAVINSGKPGWVIALRSSMPARCLCGE